MKKCNHKWEFIQIFPIKIDGKEFWRCCFICKKCQVVVHKPIIRFKDLEKADGD